jgi:3',5'-cyclic AMP phosphodiesterase CpdA
MDPEGAAMRIHVPPAVEPALPARAPGRRRRIGVAVIAVVGLLALVGGSLYGRQLWSVLTHRKGAPTVTWPVPPFAADARPLSRIAVAGDVGEGEEEEWQTAWAMRQVSFDDAPYDALLLLGDNVYPSGDPARLAYTVFRPFAIVLEQQPALLAIVGNHDAGYADEQMDILGMPGTWWTTTIGEDVRVIGLDSNHVDDPRQLAFLEETLRDATEPWKIVAVHEPPYSAGYQGSNLAVRDTFGPVFERGGVQLVLSGHEHDYQRTEPIRGVTYVISGAAGRTRGTGDAPLTAASWSVLHFVDVNVYDDHLLIRAIDQNGRAFDEVVVDRT